MDPESYAEFIDPQGEYYPRITERKTSVSVESEGILVPMSFVNLVAEKRQIVQIERNEMDYVLDLARQIADEGQQKPLLLKVDDSFKCVLKDGYHRFVACRVLGHHNIRVTVQRQEKIAGYGIPLVKHVDMLFSMMSEGRTGILRSG